MAYKLAIFDLDGTLLDTLDDLAGSVNYALKTESLPARTIREVRSFIGNGLRNLIDRSVPQGTDAAITDRVFATFKAHYALHSKDITHPYEGVCRLLTQIRTAGCRIAILSNKADFAVQELCRLYFDGLYDFAAGERAGIPKKPAPDSVWAIADMFAISRSDCVYIGDSEVDIETARNADMNLICVDWGFRDRDILINAGAGRIVSDIPSLEAAILA